MGFFDSARSVSASLAPLSVERIEASLARLEVEGEVLDNGGVLVHFENCYFMMNLGGSAQSVLMVSGTLREMVPLEGLGALRDFAEDWNREQMFPKVFSAVMEGEETPFAVLRCEVNMPYSSGLTDEQLDEHLTLAFSTVMSCFESAGAVLAGGQGGE